MAVLSTGFKKHIEVMLQTEAAECGLACLAMISTFHGQEVELRVLRQQFGASLMGTTLAQLVRNARELGFVARPVRAEIEELPKVELPCILHFDLNHFVVLIKIKGARYVVLDPAYGTNTLTQQEFSKRFTGVLLELIPDLRFQRRKTKHSDVSVTNLLGRIRGAGAALSKIFVLSAVIEVFALLVPFLNQWAIDEAIVSGDLSLLYTIIAGFVIVTLAQTATEALREFALLHFSASLSVQWYSRVYARLIKLPLDFFAKRQLGDVLARADTVATIQTTISAGLIEGVVDGIMAAGTFGVMLFYSITLALISAGILSLYVALRAAIYTVIRASSQSQFVFGARLHTYLIETIRGMQTIKLFGKEGYRLSALVNRSILSKNAALAVARYAMVFRLANALLFRLETVVVLALAGTAVINKTFTVGMLVAFMLFREQFARRISSLVDRIFDFKMLSVQTERLADIMLERPESIDRVFPVPLTSDCSELTVQNLCYRYAPDLPDVLTGISFSVRAGEHVVIVGPSGCGKTTLLKLLTGLSAPTSGDIRYGDASIEMLGRQYRDICATVTQDDTLFAGSIAENITFFDEYPEHEVIRDCAIMAGINDEILRMPMGYETLVGDMGSVLSGGQKQRVLLARALYKRPKILLLDEATSHLDSQKEREVLTSISSLKITRVIIAHRRETIEAADRIIDLPSLSRLHGHNPS